MPVKKKTKAPGQGMTAKQMKRRKPISQDYMLPIEPLTDNQKVMFDAWDEGKMIYATYVIKEFHKPRLILLIR